MTVWGILALVLAWQDPSSKDWLVFLAAAIGAMAFANLELKGRPMDESLCKLAPVLLTVIGAWFAFVLEPGEERALRIDILLILVSIFLTIFALPVMFAILSATSPKDPR